MIKVQFNIGPSRAALAAAKRRIGDLTPLHQDIKEYLIKATRERFAAGVSPEGKTWAAKKQSTIDHYARRGYGGLAKTRTLYLTGRLSREIVGFANRDAAIVGSNLIYAGVMQDGASRGAFGTTRRGGSIPWGTIPARRWLGLSAQDEREIVAMADEHMAAGMGGAD